MILIGNKLRTFREGKRLTQEQLGKRLGVSASTVSSYENDSRRPPYDVLVGYVRIFRVSADFILGTERRNVDQLSRLNYDRRTLINELTDFF